MSKPHPPPGDLFKQPDCPPNSSWDPDLGQCIPNCPPGTVFDPFTLQCIPDCDFGFQYNPVTGACEPIGTPTTLPPVTIPIPGGGGSVTVNVNNAVTVTDQILTQLSQAVADAIKAASDAAARSANDAAHAVSSGISSVISGITGGVNSFFGGVASVLADIAKGVASNVGQLVGFIKDNLGNILSDIRDSITSVIGPVVQLIDKVAKQVQEINDTLIQPVTTTILATIQTIGTLTTTIERDLHEGISGILKIPTDIANNLTSLDATLNRSLQQLSQANKEVVSTTLGGTAEDTIHTRLQALNDSLIKVFASPIKNTTFQDVSHLTEPDVAAAGAKTFDAIWKDVITFISDLFSFGKPSLDALKTLPISIPFLFGETIEFPVLLIGLAIALVESMEPLLEFIKDDIKLKSGLSKLNPGDALAAWVRGFISNDNLREELGVQGWDASRIKVLTDLQVYLADTSSAVDQFFRGIITSDELTENLTQHGLMPPAQQAMVRQAFKLFDVNLATRAYLRGTLTQEALDNVLRENRYTPDEVTAYKSVLLSPESVSDLIERHKRNTLYSNHLTNDTLFNTVPDDVTLAAQANGESPQTAADRWFTQFAVPGIQHWVNLFFRGIRTHTELFAAMDYWRVPQEWRDDYIQAQRSLIPFRTIPAMVKADIISEAYAAKQLAAHGFDDTAINALLKYAARQSTTPTAATAIKQHGESVQVAAELFHLGAITESQYSEVLREHGYTDVAITAEVRLASLRAQIQHRKDVGAEIIAEALAGQLTYEQAQQQLANQGFTTLEQSKLLKTLRAAKKAQSKFPSEAQLVSMVKNNIIDQPTFTDTLIQQGFSQVWADRITTLHFASATATGA